MGGGQDRYPLSADRRLLKPSSLKKVPEGRMMPKMAKPRLKNLNTNDSSVGTVPPSGGRW